MLGLLRQLVALVNQAIANILAVAASVAAILPGVQTFLNGLQSNLLAWNQQHLIQDPLTGLLAIVTAIQQTLSQTQAVAQRQLTTTTPNAVILPPAPPPGYGGASSGDVWSAVNEYDAVLGAPIVQDTLLAYAGNLAFAENANVAKVLNRSPFFVIEPPIQGWIDPTAFPIRATIPAPDWTDIRPSDTVLTWLTRTEPLYSWSYEAASNTCQALYAPAQFDSPTLRCILTTSQLQAIAGRSLAATPPVWPGLAGVTLGAPVAISPSFDVPGPLQGVLFDLTSPPSGQTLYVLGTAQESYNWGHIGFEQDNGQSEPFQYLSFQQGMYLPRQMSEAMLCHVFVKGSPTGTVTPFTIP